MIKVNPDHNMRTARLLELARISTQLQTVIRDQESAGCDGDQAIVALRAKKVAAHRAELAEVNAEMAAIRGYGKADDTVDTVDGKTGEQIAVAPQWGKRKRR